MLILDGKVAASSYKSILKEKIAALDRKPCLAIINFNDPASLSYLKGRYKIANELDVNIQTISIDEKISKKELETIITKLNEDKNVDGIMIDRPLPKPLVEDEILSLINPLKDVDGYSPINLGKLLWNKETFYAATPMAALKILEYYNIDVAMKNCLVIGRSINVGKPLALLLLNHNATVTIAHSKTTKLKEKCQKADIIFLAVGKKDFLLPEDVNENTIIVDIGINFKEDGKMCGDCSNLCYSKVLAYTPVPGGVGVLTNVILMENLLKAYKLNLK